jgi:beta-1,4-mannosyl-glycoprotein beta-1,4-N-acetylglucosaminyltransferase
MIYDCFTFFNELDLLDVRLHELAPVVDRFVLVEATRTHQKRTKPLYFEQNKAQFGAFADRIIHVVVDSYPTVWQLMRRVSYWDFENHQRNQILRGLGDAQPDDMVIISDVDEIPAARCVGYHDHLRVFQLGCYYYYLNCRLVRGQPGNHEVERDGEFYWNGPVSLRRRDVTTPQAARNCIIKMDYPPGTEFMKDAGWHFSYLGGVEGVVRKLESYGHSEYNTAGFKNPERIRKCISEGRDLYERDKKYGFVSIDESYPQRVRKNFARFRALIRDAGGTTPERAV